MTSVLEKITLYDFFGYLIPGITLETIVCSFIYLKLLAGHYSSILNILSEMGGYLYVLYFLFGYVAGILISQLARWLFIWIEKWFCGSYSARVSGELKIEKKTVWRALIYSGLTEKDCGEPENYEELLTVHMPMMLGIIQTDEKYKRIHVYSSHATMCRNLSAAIALAGLISVRILFPLLGCCRTLLFAALCVSGAVIFGARYERFYVKKGVYTVTWFVEKNITDKEKRGDRTKGKYEQYK